MDAPRQLSPIEAYESIRRLLAEGDTIGFSRHAIEQARRRNVTVDDVRAVLENGTVSPTAEWDGHFRNWRYSLSGFDCERDPLVIVIALIPAQCRITVITVKDVSL